MAPVRRTPVRKKVDLRGGPSPGGGEVERTHKGYYGGHSGAVASPQPDGMRRETLKRRDISCRLPGGMSYEQV